MVGGDQFKQREGADRNRCGFSSQALNIKGSDVEEIPGFGSCLNWNYIPDMAKIRDGVKILSGIDRAFKMDGIGVVERAF